MELVEMGMQGVWTAAARYALLERVRRQADARDLALVGFDVGRRVRLLLVGDGRAVRTLASGVRSGTVQALGSTQTLGRPVYRRAVDPKEALVALHAEAVEPGTDPLGTPWSSHRDLLGYRSAPFFDAGWWAGRVDPAWVHERCGGAALPPRRPRPAGRGLDLPLRVSAAVLGVLPADRRAFRLFSHLARWDGARQIDIADALMLTPRRIRQLQAEPEPRLRAAAMALADGRLCRVP
ncbi:MAG: hypothetical protein KC621_22810 [Myxococcales bacterium]|nr:hypothetical protein [Myxococcales bacterium]